MKIHIGCNKRDFGKEWISIDGGDFPHLHSHNIEKLPFEDNSAEIIYASHVIEYFDREEVLDLLREWYRVLKSGGTIRLAVPDMEVMSKLYSEGKFPLDSFLGPLYGKMKMGNKLIYHKSGYDFHSLKTVLSFIGFKNIREYDWRMTPPHDKIDDQSRAYLPHDEEAIKTGKFTDKHTLISLNVEGTK